ncbi:unnamed protein product [Dovyalis caffra]|uniref:Uncharacterized protein n=1 Tax=Dovyalis caffra TaxID=77055 RepID=A0AAV1SFY5_9ROSI|nr:unnamed protein product [Dovyalis caffra]
MVSQRFLIYRVRKKPEASRSLKNQDDAAGFDKVQADETDKRGVETNFNHTAQLMQGIKWGIQKKTVEIERESQSRRRSNGRDEAKS